MTERKNLTITQVEEVKKVGEKQIPKLSFKAKDGDKELTYSTFKSSLFELIKIGQTISADVDTEQRGENTNRRVVQIYVEGQPVSQKGQGYRGRSPEELDQTARTMCLSYAKDLAVADKIPAVEIQNQAEVFYNWVKKSEVQKPIIVASSHTDSSSLPETIEIATDEDRGETGGKATPTSKGVQNITELKGLMSKHKVATHEVYEILSIKSFTELTITPDEAWKKIKEAKKINN